MPSTTEPSDLLFVKRELTIGKIIEVAGRGIQVYLTGSFLHPNDPDFDVYKYTCFLPAGWDSSDVK